MQNGVTANERDVQHKTERIVLQYYIISTVEQIQQQKRQAHTERLVSLSIAYIKRIIDRLAQKSKPLSRIIIKSY